MGSGLPILHGVPITRRWLMEGVVTGFTLGNRGLFSGRRRELLPAEAITSIGTHAVMVASVDTITDTADALHELRTAWSDQPTSATT